MHNKCFRGKLQDLTKMSDEAIAGMDAHHVFPQTFGDDFKAIGINHNKAKYGAWVEHTEHLGFSYEYNQDWAGFFDDVRARGLGKVAAHKEAKAFAKMLAGKYGFDVLF